MEAKQLPEDFKELLILFNQHKVKYVLVGGWAVAYHGYPRFTADMDLFIGITLENVSLAKAALYEFGVPQFDDSMLLTKGGVFQMGRSPMKIEVINEISGVEFDEIYENREFVALEDNTQIPMISIDDIIRNKESTGRTKDLADVEMLKEIRGS